MLALEIADKAEVFLQGVSGFEPRLPIRQLSIERDAGRFCDIHRLDRPRQGGVYWFFRPDQTVFYIGKSEASLAVRIAAHVRPAVWHGNPLANYAGTSGDGWGFPAYRKLDRAQVEVATRDAILKGDFHVGWVVVEPPYTALLLEVYLQALCFAIDNRLPEFCDKLG